MKTIKRVNVVEQLEACVENSESLVQSGHDFVAFITISIGIELLGSCFDSKEFTDYGESNSRFKNGLGMFKNKWYQSNSTFLFENLRGPLVHQFRPGNNVELTSYIKGSATSEFHLKKSKNGKTYIVVDCLLQDFKNAVFSFKKKVNKQNSLNPSKLNGIFQIISSDTKGNIDINSSGTTEYASFPKVVSMKKMTGNKIHTNS